MKSFSSNLKMTIIRTQSKNIWIPALGTSSSKVLLASAGQEWNLLAQKEILCVMDDRTALFFKLWLMRRSRKYWYPHQRRSSEIPSWGWVISIAKLLRKVWSYTGHSKGEGWGGVTNQTIILGEEMDIFWNHTIPVYGNAISSAKLLDSKSNYWILIPLNAFSRVIVKIILTRICVTKKKY